MGHNGGQDWRAMLAGEDADAVKDLARYQTPDAFLKAFKEQRTALSKRAEASKLTENATPEQVAEFRKSRGLPDIAADAKPDDYIKAFGVQLPEGIAGSEADKGLVVDFLKEMNASHAEPAFAKKATDFFFKHQALQQQAIRADNVAKQKAWTNELRDEMGSKEYEARQSAAERWIKEQFKEQPEALTSILNAQLPGGGVLGNHPWFFNLIAKQAMGEGYTDRIEANALESSGRTLREQHNELQNLFRTDRQKYNTPEVQDRLKRIIGLRQSRGEIDAMGEEIKRR